MFTLTIVVFLLFFTEFEKRRQILLGILIGFQAVRHVGIELFSLDKTTDGHTSLFALQKSLKVPHCVTFYIPVVRNLDRVHQAKSYRNLCSVDTYLCSVDTYLCSVDTYFHE